MEHAPAYDIREIRPVEIAAALALLDDAPGADTIQRRLSVGAIDPADGTLRGVALHQTLDPRGCVVHLHCNDPDLARLLLDRSINKSAAEGHRAIRVRLHPGPGSPEAADTADLWTRSAWPARGAGVDGADAPADPAATDADADADEPQPASETQTAADAQAGAAAAAA